MDMEIRIPGEKPYYWVITKLEVRNAISAYKNQVDIPMDRTVMDLIRAGF